MTWKISTLSITHVKIPAEDGILCSSCRCSGSCMANPMCHCHAVCKCFTTADHCHDFFDTIYQPSGTEINYWWRSHYFWQGEMNGIDHFKFHNFKTCSVIDVVRFMHTEMTSLELCPCQRPDNLGMVWKNAMEFHENKIFGFLGELVIGPLSIGLPKIEVWHFAW